MTADPAELAQLHAEAFDAPWPESAFADLLAQPGVVALSEPDGFILIRTVADEAEILTLAVRPLARRRGLARRMVESAAVLANREGASHLFLEVAEDNFAARALYAATGFQAVGGRAGYYARAGGARVDALVLSRPLP